MVMSREPPGDWAEQLAAAGSGPGTRPEAICRMCVSSLGVGGAGISMTATGGALATVCASDDTAARIEELQFTLGEGPCFDALARGGPVLVADLTDPSQGVAARWPGFTAGAAEVGVRAVFAFPLRIGAIRLGAMDLYRERPGELTPGQLGAALMAADEAALALPQLSATEELDGDSTVRSSYRLEVHQASGMVAIQLGVSLAEALARLRAYAYAADRPVNEVAADVVALRLRFRTEDAHNE
jgi:hypothetical protein